MLPSILLSAMLGLVALALAPSPSLAHGGDTTAIHACVKLVSGNIRIVGANDTCRPSEAPLDWSQTAPALRCPAGTTLFVGVCIENAARAPATQGNATRDCSDEGSRLPSGGELQGFRELPGITLAANGEWSDDLADVTAGFTYFIASDAGGGVELAGVLTAYRCVTGPLVE